VVDQLVKGGTIKLPYVGIYMQDKGIKRVYLMAPNYPAGKDFLAGFKRYFKGEIVDEVYTAFGQLDYAASVSTSDTGTSITYDYKGDLTWSGDVEGGCVIDMQGSVTTTTGGVGPGSVSISYKGSICGYDAAATLNVNG